MRVLAQALDRIEREGLSMGEFKRGIKNKQFLAALEKLAAEKNWWRDVLVDASLIIAVRDEYLNVYWQGQSIFKVSFKNGEVVASTHPKYLLNPDISGQVLLLDGLFDLKTIEATILTREYEHGTTIAKLKRAAALYSGREKEGVHAIAIANPSLVDVEIAMSANGLAGIGKLPRIDMAAFEPAGQGINLVFWEAKTFSNPEVKSGAVVSQIAKYQKAIAAIQPQIEDSYQCVASNLVAISEMSGGKRPVSDSIHQVALSKAQLMISESNVGLIVYGFDADQRNNRGNALREKLTSDLAKQRIEASRVKFKGDPRGLKI
jgi:hypothetical protein